MATIHNKVQTNIPIHQPRKTMSHRYSKARSTKINTAIAKTTFPNLTYPNTKASSCSEISKE